MIGCRSAHLIVDLQKYWTTPDDKPCKVCGTLNDSNAPDLCNGTGSRIMHEAADTLDAIEAKLAKIKAEIDADMTPFTDWEAEAIKRGKRLQRIAVILGDPQ